MANFRRSSPVTASLIFDHAGGDDFGLGLDNVVLVEVPEPAGALCACAAAAMLLRRRHTP